MNIFSELMIKYFAKLVALIFAYVVLTVAILGSGSMPAVAEEPKTDVPVLFKSGLFEWSVSGDGDKSLAIVDRSTGKQIGRYDLAPCTFCAGEDDNCSSDGIWEINLANPQEEPIVAAICHVGAHSQRLSIFTPLRDPENPAFTATGAYWINIQEDGSRLRITYDKAGLNGEFQEVREAWPN